MLKALIACLKFFKNLRAKLSSKTMCLFNKVIKKLSGSCDSSSDAQLRSSHTYLLDKNTLFWSHIIA